MLEQHQVLHVVQLHVHHVQPIHMHQEQEILHALVVVVDTLVQLDQLVIAVVGEQNIQEQKKQELNLQLVLAIVMVTMIQWQQDVLWNHVIIIMR